MAGKQTVADDTQQTFSRRRYLTAVTGGCTAVAGCLGGDSGTDDDRDDRGANEELPLRVVELFEGTIDDRESFEVTDARASIDGDTVLFSFSITNHGDEEAVLKLQRVNLAPEEGNYIDSAFATLTRSIPGGQTVAIEEESAPFVDLPEDAVAEIVLHVEL